MGSYDLVLSEAAAMTLATAARGEQRKLAVILDEMKAAPFRRGDLQERDMQGRINEVIVVGSGCFSPFPPTLQKQGRRTLIFRLDC